jgi:hypothetical protein
MLLSRKDSSSPSRSLCVARDLVNPALLKRHADQDLWARCSRLVIANAVQFSVCSGVLRVLGLARASPSGVALNGAVEGAKPSAQNSQIWLFSRRKGPGRLSLKAASGPLGRNVAALTRHGL